MRIFVYEYLTGGGAFLSGDQPPTGSMLREGAAMLTSLLADLREIKDAQVTFMRDGRLAKAFSPCGRGERIVDRATHVATFDRLVRAADLTLLIAPEIDGRLYELTARAEQLGARLLCPDSRFVALASDKLATTAALRSAGVAVPLTFHCRTDQDVLRLPAGSLVCKPIDGAGSWQVRLTDRAALLASWQGHQDVCVQVFCAGRAASVAALCDGAAACLLPPCWQRVEPPRFEYQGGETIAASDLIARAHRLAQQTFAALPPTRGYVGIDLVLGASPDGRHDVVIEVNPRLTTSYVGLRQIALPNLGHALWQRATGQPADLSFLPCQLQFDAAGTIRVSSPTRSLAGNHMR